MSINFVLHVCLHETAEELAVISIKFDVLVKFINALILAISRK
jgi:hypothetical protein